MKVYEAVASALVAEGIDAFFGVMGDGNMSLWAAVGAQGKIPIYDARNEAGAVAMADGYFRATGRPSVAAVTCGPGLTQTGTSLVAAVRNKSPVVVLIGEVPLGEKNSNQTMDQRRFAEACNARYYSVSKVDNLAEEVAEAFFSARMGRGPVVLGLPMDLQEKELDWDFDYRPSSAFLPPRQEDAQDSVIEILLEKLINAERPVLIAGRGARLAGAKADLVELGDLTGALLATSLQGKAFFADQPFDIGIAGTYASAPGEELFSEADFVLGVGAEIGYYTSEGGLLFPSAEVARIDIAPPPQQIGVIPGLHVQGDARKTVRRLNEKLKQRGVKKVGFRTPQTRAIMEREQEPIPRGNDGMDPRLLMKEVSKALPRDVLITCGVGHFLGFAAVNLAVSEAAEVLFSLQFGAIGQTLPVAFGIGLGNPGRKHLVIEGDGSLMMNLQELDSVARHKVPMVLLIWNDQGFGAEVHKLRVKGFDPSLAQMKTPDFVAIARAVGGDGAVVREESLIGAAIEQGFAAGGLFVIDARVSPSTISDAYLKIHFGQPNRAPLLRYANARG